jgi:hypothetical protein
MKKWETELEIVVVPPSPSQRKEERKEEGMLLLTKGSASDGSTLNHAAGVSVGCNSSCVGLPLRHGFLLCYWSRILPNPSLDVGVDGEMVTGAPREVWDC